MTIDSTTAWNPTLLPIIKAALLDCKAIDEDEDPTSGDYAAAIFKLQNWIKEQQASGLHVWKEREAILFVQPGQYRYLLGGSTTAHTCDAWSWRLLQTSVNAAPGATTITVQTAVGVANGDVIGIVLNAGPTFWTTVAGAPTSTVITLADPLPSVISSGAFGFAYPPSAAMGRPLQIPRRSGRVLRFSGLIENEITQLSRQEYMNLPAKSQLGQINQWFYAPLLGSGELFLWNAPSDCTQAFRCTWYQSLADWLVPGDTADFPQEWASTIEWNLALELAPTYPVPAHQLAQIEKMAMAKLANVQGWDRETEAIQFAMDYEGTR